MTKTRALLGAFFLYALVLAPAAQAQEPREALGLVRLFSNDALADRRDRWRSGAFSVSAFRGPAWTGSLPTQAFSVMEYRFRGEVIAPDNLSTPAPGDRLYAGTWWLGAHTHYDLQGFEVTAGADIAITGEQSGIRSLQSSIHDLFSMPRVGLENYQVDNGIYLHGTLEMGRSLRWDSGEFRPFVELQGGVENLARAGFDVTFGSMGQGGLRARDPITGQRIAAITDIATEGGWSLLLGADTAWVDSSVFLPENRGFQAEDIRHRARLGVNYGLGDSNFFYGVTWMSEEFVGQPEPQIVGSLSVDIRF
ncbi:lipid A-modifier LpxR family protein [Roseicyclus mahoneyensis]|uniref:Uncharacterized protein DUF2219 n=1 Tax=Roseicyclus mahoneyensis TaxID=164332 RepID=A0A316GEK2_9RHOB|nr:lipid A-modifier LpxR family protein [Roseicyclus mahoneyensis]PWK59374.1 uncharacterized protein DUF2219 [Roseicyclus mahoneyensis]